MELEENGATPSPPMPPAPTLREGLFKGTDRDVELPKGMEKWSVR
jgi:hypothetical protein